MRMDRSASSSQLFAGLFGRGGGASGQRDRCMSQARRRHRAGRRVTASVVASIVFTFMCTVRLSFAPRIA
ncbi:hypothetical protein ASF73_07505 [Xanthomonas sp. Leaf131]|nr:hypothetical protein ASF73_07505 [Xanthomonas sp. Leaf131]